MTNPMVEPTELRAGTIAQPVWTCPRCGSTDLYAFYRMAVTAPLEQSGHRPWPQFDATPRPAASQRLTNMTFGCDACGGTEIAPQRLPVDDSPAPTYLLSWG
jgi:predicted RNA-binding Zn-ribbon protein involved in translation (DUF1610 family)